MRRHLLGIAGAIAIGATIIGTAVAVDVDGPTKAGLSYGSPVACYESVSGLLVCDGSPVPLPTVAVTPTPEPTTVIDTIVELPGTGTGSSR